MSATQVTVLTVKIDRNRTNEQALDATQRVPYIDKSVVAEMPHGEVDEVELVIFMPDPSRFKYSWISCADVESEYARHGVVADPTALAKAIEDDPTLADNEPIACQWRNTDGTYCYVAFHRWENGQRDMRVSRRDLGWHVTWRFAGVRKVSSTEVV